MLTILQDVVVGGMTATKFSALKTLASMLNQTGGLTTSAYVQQIADDVIHGNRQTPSGTAAPRRRHESATSAPQSTRPRSTS